jgi:hypothetical protein
MDLVWPVFVYEAIGRYITIFGGIAFGVMGFLLFRMGITKGKGLLSADSKLVKFVFSGVGPGLFFMAFGGIVLALALVFPMKFSAGEEYHPGRERFALIVGTEDIQQSIGALLLRWHRDGPNESRATASELADELERVQIRLKKHDEAADDWFEKSVVRWHADMSGNNLDLEALKRESESTPPDKTNQEGEQKKP